MKTEHEQLKEICDLIGYKPGQIECWDCMRKKDLCFGGNWKGVDGKCVLCGFEGKDIGLLQGSYKQELHTRSSREIIFTPEFMNKFNAIINPGCYAEELLKNLNNPVSYLYKLLGLGKQ